MLTFESPPQLVIDSIKNCAKTGLNIFCKDSQRHPSSKNLYTLKLVFKIRTYFSLALKTVGSYVQGFTVIEKNGPLRERRVTERFSPWTAPELKQRLRARNKRTVRTLSQLLMNTYKQMRCKANNLNRKLNREHFSSKIDSNKGNVKETWKAINQLVNKRSKTTEISTIREGNRFISDPTKIADLMNQFFYCVGKDLTLTKGILFWQAIMVSVRKTLTNLHLYL